LNVPGEDNLIGNNIHFCATCDGAFYKGKKGNGAKLTLT
jgi:thioredoxin reductase (NADPH)